MSNESKTTYRCITKAVHWGCSDLCMLANVQSMKWEREIEARNRPLSDEELDAMMPAEGYKILEPPAGYAPIRTPARKLMSTPTPLGTPGYHIPEESRGQQFDVPTELEGLPELKPEDHQYFGKLLKDVRLLPCPHITFASAFTATAHRFMGSVELLPPQTVVFA